MSNYKPWYTSNDLIESIKRKISLPSTQSLFTDTEILKFVNEELTTSQVPSVMEFHEEYFVNSEEVTVEVNQDRYPIPNRAIGLKLRSVFYKDTQGQLLELTRIDPQQKAFFSRGTDLRTNVYKYYLEGNDLVLVPNPGPEILGSLVFNYFQKPNLLVPNEQAAISVSFYKTITLNSVVSNDTITITPSNFPLRKITSIGTGVSPVITAVNHGLVNLDQVKIKNSNCTPTIDGTYNVVNCTTNTFTISPSNTVTIGGTNGTTQKYYNGYTFTANGAAGTNPFTNASSLATIINNIGFGTSTSPSTAPAKTITNISANTPTVITIVAHGFTNGDLVKITGSNSSPSIDGIYPISNVTVDNFSILVNVTTSGNTGSVQNIMNGYVLAAISSGSTIEIYYPDFNSTFTTSNGSNINIQSTQSILFDTIPTNIAPGSKIDFLQTLPGHKLLGLSVTVPIGAVDFVNNLIEFNSEDIPSKFIIGDYITPEYLCIIPFLPPDLHSGLAERACARILASIGDNGGLQASLAKINDLNGAQKSLIDNRVDGNPLKVVNRNSPLRLGKYSIIRRP